MGILFGSAMMFIPVVGHVIVLARSRPQSSAAWRVPYWSEASAP